MDEKMKAEVLELVNGDRAPEGPLPLTEDQQREIHIKVAKAALKQCPAMLAEYGPEGVIFAASGLLTAAAHAISIATIMANEPTANVADLQPSVEAAVKDLRRMLCDGIVSQLRNMGRQP